MPILDIVKKKAYHKSYRTLNKDRIALGNRIIHLRNKYGITLEQYNELLEKQDYKCAVCKRHKDEFTRGYNLAVDHDHKTLEIFGLLCYTCNHYLIGRYRNPELYKAAAEYLSKGTGLFAPIKKKRKKRVRRSRKQTIKRI